MVQSEEKNLLEVKSEKKKKSRGTDSVLAARLGFWGICIAEKGL